MRRPGQWIIVGLLVSLAGMLLGAATPWLSSGGGRDWIEVRRTFEALAFCAFFASIGGLVLAGIAWAVYRKREQLRAGTGVLASWRISLLDWAAFRRRDAARNALFHSLRNRLRLPAELPPEGMEIRIGTDALLVGDACYGFGYFASRGRLVDVALVEGQPDMLELVTHQQGKNNSRLAIFRVPVPQAARADAQGLVEHFVHTIDPRRRETVLAHFGPHFQAATGDAGEVEAARNEESRRNWRATGLALLITGLFMLGVNAWIAQGPVAKPSTLHIFILAAGLTTAAGVACLVVSMLRRR